MLIYMGFPYTLMGSSVVGDPPASAGDTGDLGSISGLERFPGEGNGNPLQYSCLRDPMDRAAWGPPSTGSQRAGDDFSA